MFFLPKPHKVTELQSNWIENMVMSRNRNRKEEEEEEKKQE